MISTADAPPVLRGQAELKLIIQKVSADSLLSDSAFVNTDGQTSWIIPVDELLQKQAEVSPGFQWVCLMTSFFDSNLATEVFDQEFATGIQTAQFSTLDDAGVRISDIDGGYSSQEDSQSPFFSLYYSFDDGESTDFYQDGLTKCMHWDEESSSDSLRWSSEGCTTFNLLDQ